MRPLRRCLIHGRLEPHLQWHTIHQLSTRFFSPKTTNKQQRPAERLLHCAAASQCLLCSGNLLACTTPLTLSSTWQCITGSHVSTDPLSACSAQAAEAIVGNATASAYCVSSLKVFIQQALFWLINALKPTDTTNTTSSPEPKIQRTQCLDLIHACVVNESHKTSLPPL